MIPPLQISQKDPIVGTLRRAAVMLDVFLLGPDGGIGGYLNADETICVVGEYNLQNRVRMCVMLTKDGFRDVLWKNMVTYTFEIE
jgi:S-adenosylmethionine hydrolase